MSNRPMSIFQIYIYSFGVFFILVVSSVFNMIILGAYTVIKEVADQFIRFLKILQIFAFFQRDEIESPPSKLTEFLASESTR